MTEQSQNAQNAQDAQHTSVDIDLTGGGAEPTTPDEIRADIERTRVELAETVDQLSEKLNVKHQASMKIDSAKQAASEKVSIATSTASQAVTTGVSAAKPYGRQIGMAAGGAAVLAVVLMLLGRRRRRHA